MHLLEAFLAFYEVTGDAAYIGLAAEQISLLKTRFVNAGGFLLEYFDAQLSPLKDAQNWAEPGHHFEWVWLLHEYARLSRGTVDPIARRLFDTAVRHGVDAEGFALARVASNGAALDETRMLWAQTEMLKACLARGEDVRPILSNIGRFLPSSPAGIWYEKLDAQGSPIRHRMPASTFYHLTGAITQLLRSRKAAA
jgi:mannose/cellobiose epimerase-like protein (N-acyl-D-glucosamine 2-epimerase family)